MVAIVQKKKDKLVGFQADEDMHGRVKQLARQRGYDTYADWLRTLVNDAIATGDSSPNGHEPDIIEKLAKLYEGWIAPELGAALKAKNVNQPRLIAALLPAILEHVQRAQNERDLYTPVLQFGREWFEAHPIYSDTQGSEHAVAESSSDPALAASPVDPILNTPGSAPAGDAPAKKPVPAAAARPSESKPRK